MKVRNLMTEDVFTLRPDHRLDLAEDMMNWQRIRHIPVVDAGNRLLGLVTHRDLLKASVSSLAKISKREQRELYAHLTVEQIMSRDVMTIGPDSDLQEAASLMIENKIGSLPVVENGKLCGILTEADFLTLAWQALKGESKSSHLSSKQH